MLKRKRSLIALLLILIMTFALSLTVSAASSKTVAKIGSKNYSSLQQALDSVKKGQTIKLMKNVTLSNVSDVLYFKRNVKFTLNLNKKTIKHKSSSYYYFFVRKGNITIKNGTINAPAVQVDNNANVTFQNVKLTDSDNTPELELFSNAKATLKKCKIPTLRLEAYDKSKLTITDGTYGDVWNMGNGTVTIQNGTFQQIHNNGNGKTLIKNGKIKISDATDTFYRIGVNKGSMIINNMNYIGGTAGISVDNGAVLNIKGGTYTTKTTRGGTLLYNRGKTTISGGTFIRKNTLEFYKDQGIWNAGTLTIKPGVVLKNCGVVNAQ